MNTNTNKDRTLRKNTSTLKLLKIMCVFCMLGIFAVSTAVVGSATAADGVKGIYDYVVDITKIAGSLMALFGIIQIGVSIAQTHDASQRMTGILLAAGGAIIFFATDLLTTMGVAP